MVACTTPTRTGTSNSGETDPTFAALKARYAPLNVDDAARQKRLAQLRRNFLVTKDEFDKDTKYLHRAFSKYMNGNGTTLVAEVLVTNTMADDPILFVESEYVGQDWIFGSSFTVKVGDNQVYTYTGESRREVMDGGGVCELAISNNAAKTVAVADLIARAANQPVRVRLSGEHIKDFTLRPAHQKAIAETLELWRLLGGSSKLWPPEKHD